MRCQQDVELTELPDRNPREILARAAEPAFRPARFQALFPLTMKHLLLFTLKRRAAAALWRDSCPVCA